MYFLLISCVVLLGAHEYFVSAGPSSTDFNTEPSNIPNSNTDPLLRVRNSQQPGYPCLESARNFDLLQKQGFGTFYSRNMMVNGMMCMCNVPLRHIPMRDDYQYSAGIGAHKLHTRPATWNDARKICIEEGGHLAIINSVAEERILLDMFDNAVTAGLIKISSHFMHLYVGTHDLYKEGDWVTVLDDPLPKTGFSKWSTKWGGQPDNGGGRQHCGALVKEGGGLDDVACDIQFPFVCELPMIQLMRRK